MDQKFRTEVPDFDFSLLRARWGESTDEMADDGFEGPNDGEGKPAAQCPRIEGLD